MKKALSLILSILLSSLLFSACGVQKTEYTNTCSIFIECRDVFDNIDKLNKDKFEVIPKDGLILSESQVGFTEGESVYDVLRRICMQKKIHLDASITPAYNTAYVRGINNLYEFDCGECSGWTYSVNGKIPPYGCSDYTLSQGDKIIFHYICEFTDDFSF